jgi:hypothetical protein
MISSRETPCDKSGSQIAWQANLENNPNRDFNLSRRTQTKNFLTLLGERVGALVFYVLGFMRCRRAFSWPLFGSRVSGRARRTSVWLVGTHARVALSYGQPTWDGQPWLQSKISKANMEERTHHISSTMKTFRATIWIAVSRPELLKA